MLRIKGLESWLMECVKGQELEEGRPQQGRMGKASEEVQGPSGCSVTRLGEDWSATS